MLCILFNKYLFKKLIPFLPKKYNFTVQGFCGNSNLFTSASQLLQVSGPMDKETINDLRISGRPAKIGAG
jgi:hypothetical protein